MLKTLNTNDRKLHFSFAARNVSKSVLAKVLVVFLAQCWNRFNRLRTTLFLRPTFAQRQVLPSWKVSGFNFQVFKRSELNKHLIKQLSCSRLLDMRLVIANLYPTCADRIICKCYGARKRGRKHCFRLKLLLISFQTFRNGVLCGSTVICFSIFLFIRKPRETAYQNQILVNSKPVHLDHKRKPKHRRRGKKHHKRHSEPPKKKLSAIFEEADLGDQVRC